MPVYARCPQCGKAYAAEDNMAGQDVLCRKCGTGFRLPASGGDEQAIGEMVSPPANTPSSGLSDTATGTAVGAATPSVETFDSGMKERGVGSAKSRLDVNGPVDAYGVGTTSTSQSLGENPPFDFPMAADVDRWAPKLLLALLFLWVIYEAATWTPLKPDELDTGRTHPSWAGLILAGWLLAVFVAVWLPIISAAVRRGMGSVAIRVPLPRLRRVATIACLPFAIGSVFWLAGESIPSLITGLILGCIPAGGAAFFLLRLRPQQVVAVLAPIVVGVGVSAGVSGVATWGVSTLLATSLKTYKTAELFAGSPLGPCLAWPQPEAAKPTASTPPSRQTGTGATPPRTVAATQTPLVPASPLVQNVQALSLGDGFDAVTFAGKSADLVALSRRGKTDETIELWSLTALRKQATAKFAAETVARDVALSPDGRLLARIATFPRLSVQAWSFVDGRVTRSFTARDDGDCCIVGFTPAGEILVQSARPQKSGNGVVFGGLNLEVLDPLSSARRSALELSGTYSSVVTYSSDLSRVAVINVAAATPALEIHQVGGASDTPPSMPLDGVDAALAAQPAAIAFSPDGKQIAVAFEKNRQVVLIVRNTVTGAAVADYVYPGGLDLPPASDSMPRRSLVWLSSPDMLVYAGNVVFDPANGRCYGSLGLGDVQRVVPLGDRSLLAEAGADPGNHRLLKVKLSSQLGTSTAPTPAAPVEVFKRP